MRETMASFKWNATQQMAGALWLACVSLLAVSAVMAQVAAPKQEPESTSRLLSIEEGRSIVNAAWELDKPARGTQDCSHLVHQVYLNAGFKYPYASSFEIYAGNENFARVKFPHAGDLIVWPGHVGIVVDSLQHNFYSLVSTGLEAQDYQSPYWRSRGRPRFYRYKVESGAILSAAKTPAPPRLASGPKTRGSAAVIEEQTSEENSSSNRPPKKVSERTAEIYGPPAPPAPIEEAAAFEIPSSIIIAQGNKLPTREEIAEGIFELSDAVGNVLRSDDPLKIQLPVVIVEQFKVERVEFKRDHGWARLQIDSKVVIGGGTARLKRQRERVRWELRRTESGWEAVTPVDRNYVPHDVAVKHLAAQLARLAASDDAAAHQEAVMQQESHLANLLSMLLESN